MKECFCRVYVSSKLEQISKFELGLYKHCLGVAYASEFVGEKLKLSKQAREELWCAGALHDYGKLFVDEDILNKNGRLDDFEYTMVKLHVLAGYNTLSLEGALPERCLLAIKEHHERIDGSGYPDGISDISLYGQILGACDVFDALVAKRVYKDGLSAQEALEIVNENCFRKDIVYALEEYSKSNSCPYVKHQYWNGC